MKAFFRAFTMTMVCIGCVGGIYLGFCKAYESIRQTCFGDHRGAVVLSEEYVKFFDMEFYRPAASDNN